MRFRAAYEHLKADFAECFQYLIGAIQSGGRAGAHPGHLLLSIPHRCDSEQGDREYLYELMYFQYLIGAIQSNSSMICRSVSASFQYLIGAIQSPTPAPTTGSRSRLSIPHRCDSEGDSPEQTIREDALSIPHRCDSELRTRFLIQSRRRTFNTS